MELSKLQESLLALGAIKGQIQTALRIMKRHVREMDTAGIVGDYLLIRVCSFLDEWMGTGRRR
jgi:hypothetical protein